MRLYRALGQTDQEDILAKCHAYSISVRNTPVELQLVHWEMRAGGLMREGKGDGKGRGGGREGREGKVERG